MSNYRMDHLVADLGLLDLDFECSAVCPTLPRLLGVWQKHLGKGATLWNRKIIVIPTQIRNQMGHPVLGISSTGHKSSQMHLA